MKRSAPLKNPGELQIPISIFPSSREIFEPICEIALNKLERHASNTSAQVCLEVQYVKCSQKLY